MTYTEIEMQARQLSLDEQIRLIQSLLSQLHKRVAPELESPVSVPVEDQRPANRIWPPQLPKLALRKIEESPEEYQRRLAAIPPGEAMLGAIQPVGHILTDEEIREDYTNYLIRKYS